MNIFLGGRGHYSTYYIAFCRWRNGGAMGLSKFSKVTGAGGAGIEIEQSGSGTYILDH